MRTTIAFSHRPKASWLPLLQEEREPADDILAYVRLISDRLLREEADISLQLALVCGGVSFTLCISDRASALRTTITGDTLTIEVEPTWWI